MLEVLYFIGIFPIQTLLEGILSLFYTLTESYGLSFILLSFSIQIFLLKLLAFFEHKSQAFNALKQSVNSKREEFKRVFKGAELMSYTQILYKQRGFHPLFALFSLGGLALQIPLFIALIILVNEAEFLKGVGFLWISDLSKPDVFPDVFMNMQSMQALNSYTQETSSFMLFNHPFTFHLLPFIMCMLSLGSVWIYTQDRGQRIQGICISLLFLVLLYNMPSALVLYWSSNMLFTLLKGLWWRVRQDKNKKQKKDKEQGESKELQGGLEYLKEDGESKQRLENILDSESKRESHIKIGEGSKQSENTGEGENKEEQGYEGLWRKDGESNRLDSKLNASSLENLEYPKENKGSKQRLENILDSESKRESHLRIGLKDRESGSNQRGQNLERRESLENLHPLKPQSRFSRVWRNIFTPHNELKADEYKAYKHISILAIINICFMICVFSPFAVYSSDVSQFDPGQTYQTLGALFGVFILSSLLLIYFTSFFYKSRLLKLGAYGMSVILLIGVVYTFVLTGDYGVMDHFVLQKLNFANYELRVQKITQALLAFSGSALFAFICLRYLKMLFSVSLITLVILSFINLYEISQNRQMYLSPAQNQGDNKSLNAGVSGLNNEQESTQPYEKELFSYSKTEKNIVVIVLDMFSGSHMKAILEQFPEFKTKLDGFVWFDNAVSNANISIYSFPSMIGGEYFTSYNINERRENIDDAVVQAFGTMGNNFAQNGYDVAYFMSAMVRKSNEIPNYNKSIYTINNQRLYFGYYLNAKGLLEKVEQGNGSVIRLLSVGLFRFAPELFFRGRIYNDGLWLVDMNESDDLVYSMLYDSSMYAFSHLHNSESQKPTFKFLHSMISHSPYGLYYDGGKCSYFSTSTILDEYPRKEEMKYNKQNENQVFQHYDSELCALSYLNDFIGWLKSEGIYDNTQIFIMGDHGGFSTLGMPEVLDKEYRHFDSLFLFKEFGAKGQLQIDSRLMVGYDASSIFCENLPDGCPNVPANILKNYPQNRSIITTVPDLSAVPESGSREWVLNHIYRVKGNIYKEEDWMEITQEGKDSKLKFGGINR